MQLNAQGYIRQFESLHSNTWVRLYPTYDNQVIYTTDWARYIYKIDANMNTIWRIEPRGLKLFQIVLLIRTTPVFTYLGLRVFLILIEINTMKYSCGFINWMHATIKYGQN